MSAAPQKKSFTRKFEEKNKIPNMYDLLKEIDVNNLDPVQYRQILNNSFKNDSAGPGYNKNVKAFNANTLYLSHGIINPHSRQTESIHFKHETNKFDLCRSGAKHLENSFEFAELKKKDPDATPRFPSNSDVAINLSEFISVNKIEQISTSIDIPYEETRIVSPDAEYSLFFKSLEIICRVFENECKIAISNGDEFIRFLLAEKKKTPSITAQDALNAYNAQFPNIHNNHLIIISDSDKKELRGFQKDGGLEILLNEILVVPSKEIHICIGSNNITEKNGVEIPKKMRSFKLKIPHKADGAFSIPIYDINKSNTLKKLTAIETVPSIDGEDVEPLSSSNISRILTAGTEINGKFYMVFSATKSGLSAALKADSISLKFPELKYSKDDEFDCWEAPIDNTLKNEFEDFPPVPPALTRTASIAGPDRATSAPIDDGNDTDSAFDLNDLNSAFEDFGTEPTALGASSQSP